MASSDDGRRASLTPALFGEIASFLGPRDQAALAQVNHSAEQGVHTTNPALRHITASAQVGGQDLFHIPNPHAPATQAFHPLSPTGVRSEYPHLTLQAKGGHFTDLVNPTGHQLSQVRHDLLPSGALGPAKPVPAKDGNLLPSVSAPGRFVRQKDMKKDAAGTLNPKFTEPVSPRSQHRALAPPKYEGLVVKRDK